MEPGTYTAEQMDAVYEERNKCVALIYHMANLLGYPCGLRQSSDFEPGWQNCVMIDLPTGQISWHIKDSQEDWFAEGNMLKGYTGEWDGHTTEEKYQRVLAFADVTAGQHVLHMVATTYSAEQQQSWPEAYHRAAYPLEPRSAPATLAEAHEDRARMDAFKQSLGQQASSPTKEE